MFFGGHNGEFCEQNFAHKSEHDKRLLQRNSREDFAVDLLQKSSPKTGATLP